MYGPAKKHGNSYQYETSFVHAGGPCHPHTSRSALLRVCIGGTVKMLWVQNDNKLEETLLEIESVKSSDELVTHAALVSDKSSNPLCSLPLAPWLTTFSRALAHRRRHFRP